MNNNLKFPVDPKCLAQVRDEALVAAKKSGEGVHIALAALADEILQSYSGSEVRELQKKKLKIGIG